MKQRIYVVDTETITEECMKKHNLEETYAWAVGFTEIIENHDTGNFSVGGFGHCHNLDEFFKKFSKLNTKVFCHNLKFDGKFIIDWLEKNNYIFTPILDKDTPGGTFSCVIDDMNNWYSIEIVFTKGHNGRRMRISDSLKKIPLSVEEIGDSYCSHMGLCKGEIDYHVFRSKNHIMTKQELDYLKRDCDIVAYALCDHFNQGMDRLTISSDAMKKFKESLGDDHKTRRLVYEKLFPQISDFFEDFSRNAYRGGYTFLNPYFQSKRLKGRSYDVNSLYPYVMLKYPMPYGMPITEDEYKKLPPQSSQFYDLYIIKIRVEFFELYDRKTPIIQIKDMPSFFPPRDYLYNNWSESYGGYIPVELYLTSIDYEMIKENYNLDGVTEIEKIYFKSISGIFNNYISYWRQIKENSKGGTRQIAKLLQNSLYGKFATKTKRINKMPILDGGKISYAEEFEGKDSKMFYTPISCFITAYARRETITAINNNIDHFIYCDTDSIHLADPDYKPNIEIHKTEYGKWKMEYEFRDSKFLRPKTYMEEYFDEKSNTWKWNIKAAGLNDQGKKQVTLDNFKIGGKFERHVMRTVPGGCVLASETFEIKDLGHLGEIIFNTNLTKEAVIC